ncbi:MAG: CoA-binding protein [Thaumarchaeota archaeon]|nr:MAG: CoA-binding protein [Nitrososphaerota archaeon]
MATSREVEILLGSRTIAVVGLSKDPSKESFSVSKYLKEQGYRIIPVNPTASKILGERVYPSLLEIPTEEAGRVEVVDIFRPSEQVPPIVEQAIQLRKADGANPKMIWMQLGIESPAAAEAAKRAGMAVVQNLCVRTEHRRAAHTQGRA